MEKPAEHFQQERLQELAAKSWNLEMIISGAAIFLVSYLPEGIDKVLKYYLENMVLDENIKKITLPLLAYSFIKVVSWVLIFTFLVHFAIRAFWAGLVGLHAVFPHGIQYDKLPSISPFTQKLLAERFGQLSDYITRLDKLCNQVFSMAFVTALMGVGISSIYLMYFALETLLPLLFGPEMQDISSMIGALVIFILAILPAVAQLFTKKEEFLDRNPRLKKVIAFIVSRLPQFMMPFVYRPINYVTMTFNSNMTKRRMYTSLIVVSIAILSGVFWCFLNTIFDLRNFQGVSTRSYFAEGKNQYSMNPSKYDNLRPEGSYIPLVSIENEVVEGPFLKVFIKYPKFLDAALSRFCTTPDWPDSLKKSQTAILNDSIHLACVGQFFKVSVNDSSFQDLELLFHKKPGSETEGLVAYLPTKKFKNGKNILKVMAPAAEKPDSLRLYEQLPFWFSNEK